MSISVLQMAIVDDGTGTAHPSAIWEPGTVIMDNDDLQGSVLWKAFHSAASYAAKEQPINGMQHLTVLPPSLYSAIVNFPEAGPTYGVDTAAALDYLAINVHDTPGKNVDGTPTLDAQGQPIMVSFFATATLVQVG